MPNKTPNVGSKGYFEEDNKKKQRNKGKRSLLIYLVSGILVLCAVFVIAIFILYSDVYIERSIELGSQVPDANIFSKKADSSVSYDMDKSEIDVSKTGGHWLHILVNGKKRLVRLTVKDTVPPSAAPVEMSISINDEVTADSLISGLADADVVKLSWEEAPVFGVVGDYSVVINMEDMSGNKDSVTSMLHIRAVVDSLTYEAGEKVPELKDFLADESLNASFVTDLESMSLDTPGEYDVSIDVNGETYTTCFIVKDTIAPEIAMQMLHRYPGETAEPEDFITSANDASALTFAFLKQPDFNRIGFQDVEISATDLGGNTVQSKATLLISDVVPAEVEIRDTPLTVDELIDSDGYNTVELKQEFIPDTLGVYSVTINLDGNSHPTQITVVDTTPPNAEPVKVSWYLEHPLPAEHFVENVSDFTDITYTFAQEPDWETEAEQTVNIVLTDTTGNKSEYSTTMTLEQDTEAPTLYGVKDRYCYIGHAVAYFAEVFAEDNCDFEIPVEVDKSNVDIHSAGKYEITYTATDTSGNTVEKSCTLKFVEETVTDEELSAAAQVVLKEITTDDMSIGQKALAVFKYVKKHIKYNGHSNTTDWKHEAYNGITAGRGDCFTFYAATKCLMEEIGAKTMCVERYGGSKDTDHYWLLVNLGTGWYHVDAINVGPRNYECFMKTDEELLRRGRNFWSFNRSLYPPSPKESYVME